MKKKVIKIEVVDYVAERGSHKGEKGQYVQLTLQNRGASWIAGVNKNDDILSITRPASVVDMFKGFANEIKAGKSIEEAVPTEFREIDNMFRVNVPLDGKYLRLHRKTEVDKTTGKVLHKAGDPYTLDDGKTPRIYDSLDVLAIKYQDTDTGEWNWLQEPSSIVRDMINRGYYKPLVANAPQGEIANVEPIEEAGDDTAIVEEHEPTAEELKAELEKLKKQAAEA